MNAGTTKHLAEFAVPIVELPPVPVQLPVEDESLKKPILSSDDLMHIPQTNLPEVQFTSTTINESEQQQKIKIDTKKEKKQKQLEKKEKKIAEKQQKQLEKKTKRNGKESC